MEKIGLGKGRYVLWVTALGLLPSPLGVGSLVLKVVRVAVGLFGGFALLLVFTGPAVLVP